MKYGCWIADELWPKILPHIRCEVWANPLHEEYIFYNPTNEFLIILALYGLETYTLD